MMLLQSMAIYPRLRYWKKGEAEQNFGDYLSELFLSDLFDDAALPSACALYLVGSVIQEYVTNAHWQEATAPDQKYTFWQCGIRAPHAPSDFFKEHSAIHGVRGPLTRDLLDLPTATPLGDPALLLPLIHKPRPVPEYQGRTLCMPHILDPMPDAEMIALSKCDLLVRPAVDNNLAALRRLLDIIASADFILSGSLHGAIVAAAYGVPFAFWNTGHVDCPFKWADFAASINVTNVFAQNHDEGRTIYEKLWKKTLRLPPLLPMLKSAPLPVKPRVMMAALSMGS